MANKTAPKNTRKTSTRIRKLCFAAGICLAFLVVLYLTVTSSIFLKAVVLPRVGAALNSKVAAGELALSPFSMMTLKKLSVVTTGTEPLLSINEARFGCDLLKILRGEIEIQEIVLDEPSIHVVMSADGTSNVDVFLTQETSETQEDADTPPSLRIQNISIKNGNFRYTAHSGDDAVQNLSMTGIDFGVDQITTGQTAKISISSTFDLENVNQPNSSATSGALNGEATSELEIEFDETLFPLSIKGETQWEFDTANGPYSELAGLKGLISTDLTSTEVRKLDVQLDREGKRWGDIHVAGPWDLEESEGQLALNISIADSQALASVGSLMGVDFIDGILNTTNSVEIQAAGKVIDVKGNLTADQLTIRQESGTSPAIGMGAEYQINLDLERGTALINNFNLQCAENSGTFLKASLAQPMALNWGSTAASLPDATLNLEVDQLRLASWRAMLGTNLPSGTVSLQATLQTENDGRQFAAKIDGKVDSVDFEFDTNRLSGLQINLHCQARVDDFNLVNIASYELELLRENQILSRSGGSLRYSVSTGELDLDNNTEALLPELIKTTPVPEFDVSKGKLTFSSHISQTNNQQKVTGQLNLTDLTGNYSGYSLDSLRTDIEYDLEMTSDRIQLRSLKASFEHTNSPARTVEMQGSFQNQILELQRFNLKLEPTARANNEVRIAGRIDFGGQTTNSNQVSIQADTLDLTPFYDLLTETDQSAKPSESSKQPQPVPLQGEPSAPDLPFDQFQADIKIEQLFLREIAITNLHFSAQLKNSQLTLNPAHLAVNGAPVTANVAVNLGNPEFEYDMTLAADRVPLEPFANSFSTNSPGQFKGEFIAHAQIRSAGVTGASLQNSLTGEAAITFTNLNLQFVGPKTRRVLAPIALVLRIPELTQTPLDWASADATMDAGQVMINRLAAQSHALYAEGQGNIQITPILTNSPIEIPIKIALRRSLAEKSKLLPANTPPDAPYVPLPDFAKISGTLGEPKTDINKLVISGLLLRSAVNIPQVGERTGNLLQGIGSLLSGQNSGGTKTNSPPESQASPTSKTNQPPSLNPLDLLKMFPKKD